MLVPEISKEKITNLNELVQQKKNRFAATSNIRKLFLLNNIRVNIDCMKTFFNHMPSQN